MTDQSQVPPPPPPPPPPAVTPPDQVAPATYATPPPPPPPAEPAASGTGGGHRKAIVGGLVAAIVLGGGYGAYAVYDKLDGGGPQPHDVLPASTELYLRLDLDPSASQKIDLFRLIRKVPDLADEAGITSDKQDLRELVFKDALTDECDDVDYDRDVAPWLGDRIGVGANIEDKSFILAVQTTDEAKSRAGVKKLFACNDEKYGIAFLDGYAILAPKQADVDAAVKATAKASLGDDKDFTADFDELGNQGIASGWADLKAISKLPEVTDALGDEATEIAKAGSVATALRADGDAIELAVLGGPGSKGKSQATSLAKLPADTVAALSVAGVGDQITDQFDSFVEQFDKEFAGGSDGTSFGAADGSTADPISVTTTPDVPTVSPPTFDPDDFGTDELDPDDFGLEDDFGGGDDFSGGGSSDGFGFGIGSAQDLIDDLERETGLRLPDDLATLFGDSLTLAVGADNLETIPTLSGPEGLNALNIALSLTSDRADALDLVKRLATLASDNGISLVAAPTDDGAVLATNQDAADSIAKPDGKLGDQKAFASVIPDGDSTSGGFYLDIGTILDKLLAADPPDDVRQDIESAKALSAFGVSTGTSGDRSLFRVRLAFD